MNPRSFSLLPFPGEETGTDLKIEGTIGRRGNTLSIGCAILGSLSEIAIPLPEGSRQRRGHLWEETCLELFLAEEGVERYWEFHLSPAGHWNVYRFTRYREEMREEESFASLPFHVRRGPDSLRFTLDLDLGKILPTGKTIEAAVCSVIRTTRGRTNLWALAHPAPRPDFHRRDRFLLSIPAE